MLREQGEFGPHRWRDNFQHRAGAPVREPGWPMASGRPALLCNGTCRVPPLILSTGQRLVRRRSPKQRPVSTDDRRFMTALSKNVRPYDSAVNTPILHCFGLIDTFGLRAGDSRPARPATRCRAQAHRRHAPRIATGTAKVASRHAWLRSTHCVRHVRTFLFPPYACALLPRRQTSCIDSVDLDMVALSW